MPLDAGMVACLAYELNEKLTGARVEKIQQPDKEEIILQLHQNRTGLRLLLNGGSANPRACLTNISKENPVVAPMFCMLLRKHLTGAKIKSVTQPDFERVLIFAFESYDDMGFPCEKKLILELMGKHSNLIFTGPEEKIYTALKIIDFTTSQKRQVLPGMQYEAPPAQDRRDPLQEEKESFFSLRKEKQELSPADFILQTYRGIAPFHAKQLAKDAQDEMSLWRNFSQMTEILRNHTARPYLILDAEGNPKEYTFLPVENGIEKPDFSALMEEFFSLRAHVAQMQRRSQDISHVLHTATARLQKKLILQQQELEDSAKMEEYKIFADLITSQMYALRLGMKEAQLYQYEVDPPALVTVPLNAVKTPAQNAQEYYKRYRKAKTAYTVLTEQIEKAKQELVYLETVRASLETAETESDFEQIRLELQEAGYLSRKKTTHSGKPAAPAPMRFVTDGGFTVLCGKNNQQNDLLTTKIAEKNDYWFHIKNAPGSHAVLQTKGAEVPDEDLQQAAVIAATYSSQKDAPKVEIDYTLARYVKKPNGAKPGFVIYTRNQTAYVSPDPHLCTRLRQKK